MRTPEISGQTLQDEVVIFKQIPKQALTAASRQPSGFRDYFFISGHSLSDSGRVTSSGASVATVL